MVFCPGIEGTSECFLGTIDIRSRLQSNPDRSIKLYLAVHVFPVTVSYYRGNQFLVLYLVKWFCSPQILRLQSPVSIDVSGLPPSGSTSSSRRALIILCRRYLSHFLIRISDSKVRITSKRNLVHLPINPVESLDSTGLYVLKTPCNPFHQFGI